VLLGAEPVAAGAGRLKQNGPAGAVRFECVGSGGPIWQLFATLPRLRAVGAPAPAGGACQCRET
jgi:hypothetical protein